MLGQSACKLACPEALRRGDAVEPGAVDVFADKALGVCALDGVGHGNGKNAARSRAAGDMFFCGFNEAANVGFFYKRARRVMHEHEVVFAGCAGLNGRSQRICHGLRARCAARAKHVHRL